MNPGGLILEAAGGGKEGITALVLSTCTPTVWPPGPPPLCLFLLWQPHRAGQATALLCPAGSVARHPVLLHLPCQQGHWAWSWGGGGRAPAVAAGYGPGPASVASCPWPHNGCLTCQEGALGAARIVLRTHRGQDIRLLSKQAFSSCSPAPVGRAAARWPSLSQEY